MQDNKNMLKINVQDTFTYFRLEHEISEVKRKQEQFKILQNDHINSLINHDLVDYDKKMMDAENMNQFEVEEKIKETKSFKKGLDLGKLLKPSIKKDNEHDITEFIGNTFSMKNNFNHKESQKFWKLKPINSKH